MATVYAISINIQTDFILSTVWISYQINLGCPDQKQNIGFRLCSVGSYIYVLEDERKWLASLAMNVSSYWKYYIALD